MIELWRHIQKKLIMAITSDLQLLHDNLHISPLFGFLSLG